MSGRKKIRICSEDQLPDHIVEEIDRFACRIAFEIIPLLEKADPNVGLASIGILYASIISKLVSQNDIELAADCLSDSLRSNCLQFKKYGDPIFKESN